MRTSRSARILTYTLVAVSLSTLVVSVALAGRADAGSHAPIDRSWVVMQEHDPALDQVEVVNFLASPQVVPYGGTSRIYWKVGGPHSVTYRLDGTDVENVGDRLIAPIYFRQQHVLTAHHGGASRVLGTVTIGVQPCAKRLCGILASEAAEATQAR